MTSAPAHDQPRTTPLHAVHERLGAHFTLFAGWTMPVRYGSDVAEHHAVRTTAGLFDLSHMGEIELTGPGAAGALDHALVGKPSAMATGAARYSMICAPDGGVIDDLIVYRLATEHFLVVANASNAATVAAELVARADGFDTVVEDTTDRWALVAVQGPVSAEILGRVIDTETLDLDAVTYYSIVAAHLTDGSGEEHEVLLARTGYTGEDGFEIFCAAEAAERVWTAVEQAGEDLGLVPAGLACRDTLRLEAGMPLYGHELTRETTPYDAGLGRVVNLTKSGGFVGEAALAECRDRGAGSSLVGLLAEGRRAPRSGYAVLDPATGRQVGRVTSGAPSPTLGRPIAIASVEPAFAEAGHSLLVDVRGSHVPADVVALPFYRRPTR